MDNTKLVILTIILPFFGLYGHCTNHDEAHYPDCPAGYEQHPLILMSLDGFRSEYLTRGITPTIQKLITEGVSAPHMTASYPTVTFSNHYSIATGLYPESHGLIDNSFHDSDLSEEFSKYFGSLTEGKWFTGEPIWNTVTKNGMKSAAYFWIGSEAKIGGHRPTYYYKYNEDTPYEDRIEQVLKWLAMPIDERPSWIAVYFDEPDSTGHDYGPNSPEVNIQIERVDGILLSLLNGITNLNLTNCVNLILISDHGMSEGSEEKTIRVKKYHTDLDKKADIYSGPSSRIRMMEGYEDEQVEVMKSLSCKTEAMRVFDKKSLPKRYHYSNNPRIEDIIIDIDPGYIFLFHPDPARPGDHGYDNECFDMQAIFVASGPDLKKETKIRPFQNIELYNLMCNLLSIEPASNNGTKGALYHILKDPPSYPKLPLGNHPKIADFPDEDEITERLSTSDCHDNLDSTVEWIYKLDFGEDMVRKLNDMHLPFGTPEYTDSISSKVTLLFHSDHITGFSESLKLPIWTSFTFNNTPIGSQQTPWSSDVRLSADNSPNCMTRNESFSLHPLFRSEFSQEENMARIPFLISNSIPMTTELEERYRELMTELVPMWRELHEGPLNIIAGPAFDADFNSLVDEFPDKWSFIVPSDIFVIVTKCAANNVENIRSCAVDDLKVSAFIYRQTQTVSNCLSRDQYAEKFSARVKDIELSTGLIFFSDFGYEGAIDLTLRSGLEIWSAKSKCRNAASAINISNAYVILLFIILYFGMQHSSKSL